MRKWIELWLMSVVVVAVLASALMRAQATPEELKRRAQDQIPGSRIISGNDIGFRIEGINQAGQPVGTLVVRIDGEWVATASKMSIQRP